MNNRIEKYVWEHTSEENQVLKELDRDTHLHILHPRMISGHIQGKLMELLVSMLRPTRILEIGTFTGYSAICMATALPQDGLLHTIEINDELQAIAQSYFRKAGVENKIIQHIGDACNLIPRIDATFDLVYLDGNKREYSSYYDTVWPKLRIGGFILADNILWYEKVIEKADPKDAQTFEIQCFNNKVAGDKRVTQVILPLRDGLMLIRKDHD